MRRTSAAFLAVAASLVAVVALAEPERDAPAETPSCSPIEPGDQDVRVRWGTPTRTAGCFFFSGPGELGRDDHLGDRARLGWRGDRMTLAFGGLQFAGEAAGGAVRLTRRSAHDFGGAWRVTERISGRVTDVRGRDGSCRGIRATYRYEECGRGGACPGQCTIEATLTITR